MPNDVLFASSDDTCTITLNRPSKRHALNASMIAQLRAALEPLAASARVLIVRANGPAFSG
jgi:enoyl-CoA hydratase/carnithine racemase